MRVFVVAICAATLFAGTVGAQVGPAITESEFLAPLDAEHPAVRSLGMGVAEAQAAAVAARMLPNPELGASLERPGEREEIGLSLAWRPPHPGRRRLAIAAAEARVAASRATLLAERLALRAAMREVFARWAVAVTAAELLSTWVDRLDGLAQRERERAELGESSGLDARRLALATSEARGRLARAEADRLAATAEARAWRPDLPPVSPLLPALPPADAADSDEAPRLRALRAELAAARSGEELASRILDMPEIAGGWLREESVGEVEEGPTLGVAWTVPLFDRQRSERISARGRVEALEARVELAEREIAATLPGALAAYDALRSAALAAAAAAADAPALVAAATSAFRAGESSLTDLLETLRSAIDAELSAVELHEEALAAHRRLQALSFLSDPAEPTSAIPPTPSTLTPRS